MLTILIEGILSRLTLILRLSSTETGVRVAEQASEVHFIVCHTVTLKYNPPELQTMFEPYGTTRRLGDERDGDSEKERHNTKLHQ